jgi:MarR family transcriptional regulator, organic hydroperoxide resistance regulator
MTSQVTQDVAISEIMQSLRRIFKAIQDYSHEVSEKFGITGPQLWALKTISQNESLSLSDLSERMYLHPSTMTGVIDRLERKGYVTRSRDKVDRRVIYVQLSAEGKRLAKRAPNPAQGKMIYGLKHLKKGELNLIYDSVQKLVKIMEVENVKVIFFFDRE